MYAPHDRHALPAGPTVAVVASAPGGVAERFLGEFVEVGAQVPRSGSRQDLEAHFEVHQQVGQDPKGSWPGWT